MVWLLEWLKNGVRQITLRIRYRWRPSSFFSLFVFYEMTLPPPPSVPCLGQCGVGDR